ncbi:phenylacetate--CoA ligase family protein [Candidatus Parcubacteria bacterium]|nr:phenylacetate--CoA ligase family protein [Candidatus Parcubacteria bacterium]
MYGFIPPKIRLGEVFWETYNFLQKSQWWSREKLEEYQMEQLSKLLHHAYKNVPYYKRIFDERELKPKDIQDFGDLTKLPYLTKEIIRENLPDLVARNYPKSKLQYLTTGGSTGIPLGFYLEREVSEAKEWAFILTQWNRIGFKIGDRSVVLRGNIVPFASKNKFWEYDPRNKDLILSSYHITDETLPEYIAKIREFKPDFIQAYPSVITILARFMEENNIEPFSTVRTLLCGSENLYFWQRELLEKVFQCRVYSWYGHSEMVVLAGECETSTYYHIFPEYGFVELIDKKGNIVTGENKMGEIVATGFNNFACPFIRYRTMDLATPSNTKCECGRNYSLLTKVEGRLQDLVVTKDNRLITLTALIFAQHFEAFFKIREIQLVQEKEGEVTVKIVKTPQYSIDDEQEILSKMQRAVSSGLDINFVYVNTIPRTQSGKYRFLIQKLPIKFGD